MRRSTHCLSLPFALAFAACAGTPLTPDPLAPESRELSIRGLPSARRIRVGESILISIDSQDEVRSVLWSKSRPDVVRLVPTMLVSPCGNRCAWITGTAPGTVRLEADVIRADGAHARVEVAKICGSHPTGCRYLRSEVTVFR